MNSFDRSTLEGKTKEELGQIIIEGKTKEELIQIIKDLQRRVGTEIVQQSITASAMVQRTVLLLKARTLNHEFEFEVLPSTTLQEMMDFLTEKWIDSFIDKGMILFEEDLQITVSDPNWKLARIFFDPEHVPDAGNFVRGQGKFSNTWTDREELSSGLAKDLHCGDIAGFCVDNGAKLYAKDRNRSYRSKRSLFNVVFVQQEVTFVAKDASFPRLPPPKPHETVTPYAPPIGSQSLNDIFPHANTAMFHLQPPWGSPFPTSPSSAGFVGGGCYGDRVFMPVKFARLQEVLVAIDVIMKKYPPTDDCVDESYREVYPINIDGTWERECDERVQRGPRHRSMDDEPYRFYNPLHRYFTVCHRLTTDDLSAYDDIESIFPFCAKAYQKGLWASYRPGIVFVSKIKTHREHIGDRLPNAWVGREGYEGFEGTVFRALPESPESVLAKVVVDIQSLHNFFCVCEALFRRIDAEEKFPKLKQSVRWILAQRSR